MDGICEGRSACEWDECEGKRQEVKKKSARRRWKGMRTPEEEKMNTYLECNKWTKNIKKSHAKRRMIITEGGKGRGERTSEKGMNEGRE